LVIKVSQNASDALLSSHCNYKVLKIQKEQKPLKSSNKLEVNMAEHERYTMHCRGSISALLQPTGEILID
jgi:hypothetical protein